MVIRRPLRSKYITFFKFVNISGVSITPYFVHVFWDVIRKRFFNYFQLTPKLKTPAESSQQTEVSNSSGKEDNKGDDTEEESDSVHSDPELDYNFSLDITPYRKTNRKTQDKRRVSFFMWYSFYHSAA